MRHVTSTTIVCELLPLPLQVLTNGVAIDGRKFLCWPIKFAAEGTKLYADSKQLSPRSER